uniref:Uncharacterized protein n=1 Tax=Graphocephala atropunctata TaxID=36148 RepID=A0A1B6MFX2_9HEMI
MALSGVIQAFLVLVIVLMYSATVWKSMDAYFRDEFKKHLAQENEKLRKLRQDKMLITKEKATIEQEVQGSMGDIKIKEEIIRGQENKGGCKKEGMPANKYKNQEEEEEYLDSSEVCPFTPPLDINGEGG